MRNLDKENPDFARPQSVMLIGAILPFIMGGMTAFLATVATPQLKFSDNPIALFCISLCPLAVVSALIPKIFRWDWRAKYFGFSTIYFASFSLIGIVPWLCIVLYSALPLSGRLAIFFGYAAIISWWCRRFAIFYRKVYDENSTRELLYFEDDKVVYYSQKSDNWLIEKKYKFKQWPTAQMFIASLVIASVSLMFIPDLKKYIALPFAFTFLTIAGFPIVLMILGLSMRCYLVFYYYPWKIKTQTGKEVYVDMVTKNGAVKIKGREPEV